MTYKVVLSRQAQRYFSTAPTGLARRLARLFETLEKDPRPSGVKPLKGRMAGLFRIRLGNVRIVYDLDEKAGEIRVVWIRPRGDAY